MVTILQSLFTSLDIKVMIRCQWLR